MREREREREKERARERNRITELNGFEYYFITRTVRNTYISNDNRFFRTRQTLDITKREREREPNTKLSQ